MVEKAKDGYAIVDFAGKQFRVEAGQELKVPHTDGEAGANLQLERVLLLHDGGTTLFGQPTVAGAAVDATILGHGRDRKITVFKFRRRKGYRKKTGHRQDYSLLRINAINLVQASPAAEAPTEEVPTQPAPKKPAGKAAAPKKTTTVKKTAVTRKTTTTKKSAGAKKATTSGKSAAAKKTAAKPASKKKTGGS
ncbi:MAG: 50S ribosomal protein L21 [Candidatus Neomarinimicrobiota bacterium]